MIRENIESIKKRIAAACTRAKVDPGKITLVCVTKAHPVEQILEIISLGYKDIGENKVQEALEKHKQVSGAKWHMVGHLQSNKVKEAIKIFDLIHSVDSLGLAEEINKQAIKINKVQDILLEVKTSNEVSKFGIASDKVSEVSVEICKLSNVNLKGLMTIAPFSNNANEARPYFAQLKQLRDALNSGWFLSMGMSLDFEVAIEEGADIIRLGRAILEG
ncbi:MAG: YggS family pyridoxal phosphate-dependent enzyme [Candidatus Omnitrophota bacterium]